MKEDAKLNITFQMPIANTIRPPAVVSLAALLLSACTSAPQSAPATATVVAEVQVVQEVADPMPEIVVYTSDLPESALYEFEVWDDPASPGGTMLGVTNNGDELDPPPENDPHVTFTVPVQSGTPYRCWIHMKVGTPRGKSQANMVWIQFSGAVDDANQEILKPETDSYLTAQGPAQEGWNWVGCDLAGAEPSKSLIYFGKDGDITVRIQAGMEGVGFDQLLLSAAQYLENPPSHAVVGEGK